MSSDTTHSAGAHAGGLADFVRRYLKTEGGIVESSHNGSMDALIPESLSRSLDLPDHFTLTTGSERNAGTEETGNFPIHFGSPVLERIVRRAGSRPPVLGCVLKFNYLKKEGFDRIIREQFDFFKSTGTVVSHGEVRTRYLILTCRYLAQSDEQKEGLVELVFNTETGAFVPEMAGLIGQAEREYPVNGKGGLFTEGELKKLMAMVESRLSEAVAEEIVSFRESMTRRFRRDAGSLREYYSALQSEMEKSLERPGLSAQVVSERKEKIAMLPVELEAKKDDLYNKYSIKIDAGLSAAMVVVTPAVKVLFDAAAGNRKKTLSMIYNPLTRMMDPLVCQGCGESTFSIGFCDKLHLLCPDCRNGGCPACG